MNKKELCFQSATELGPLIQAKEISPVELTRAYLERIEMVEPRLNSYITLLSEEAMQGARQAEKDILAGGYRGPLHGIPIALKDLYYTKGVRTTSGCKLLDSFVPSSDSTIGERLNEAGAILLGKLNMHQLAYGITGENPDYGDSHNPWNTDLITGGSSGGSASAVASGECVIAMGSDTGGSIRIPGSLCGIVGLKPTYGLLSGHGLASLAWGQDHPGPMTRTVSDCALAMNIITGTDYAKTLNSGVKGLRIGIPQEFNKMAVDAEVKSAIATAIDRLQALGATVTEVSWPLLAKAAPIAAILQMSETTAYHSDLIKTSGSKLEESIRVSMEGGYFISAHDYLLAQRARVLYVRESLKMMKGIDVLVSPATPITAIKIGLKQYEVDGKKKHVISLLTQFVRPFNVNGFPAITVPCGFSQAGLPIGLQIAGRPFAEETVLRAAHAYEQSTDWHKRRPSV
jgi:aspartyl-tRNA(Asn)/glutamyl-tRNA(Gln) amidotransferase subunit A